MSGNPVLITGATGHLGFHVLGLFSAECWAPKQCEAFSSDLINEISLLPERSQKAGSDLKAFRIWPHAFRPSENEWIYVVSVAVPRPSRPNRTSPPRERETTSIAEKQYLTLDTTVGTSAIRFCSAKEAKILPEKYSTVPLPPARGSALPSHAPSESQPSAGNRFPCASQVLSRLRWDPAHSSYDYEVGYLDRFEGLMWLPLEQWGKETEDEEFIPEHRIKIFRRVEKLGPGAVVWDREKRICRLS